MSDSKTSETSLKEDSATRGDVSSPGYASFLLLYRPTLKQNALVLLGFLALIALFRAQSIATIDTHFLGGARRDAGLYIWLTQSNIRDLFSQPWFNTQAFYPYTNTLAWSDNFIAPALLAGVFNWIGFSFVASYNLVLLLAYLLNGYCTYRLCFQLTGFTVASFFSGALFANCAYLTAQLGHPQLQFAFWIPLALLATFSFISRPGFISALCIALSVFLCFLSTVYYSIFIPLMVAAVLGTVFLLRPHQFRRRDGARLILGAGIGLIPLLYVISPYLDVRNMFGERNIYEAYYFSASALSYLSFSPLSLLYSFSSDLSHAEAQLGVGVVLLLLTALCFIRLRETSLLQKLTYAFLVPFVILLISSALRPFCKLLDGSPAGLCSFAFSSPVPGYLTAICSWLSLVALVLLFRRMGLLERKLGFLILTNRDLIACFLGCAYLFFLISLGPLGNPEPPHGDLAFGVFRLLYELVPGMNSMRAISRSGIVVIFCVCVLFTFGIGLIRDRSHKAKYLLYILFCVALIEQLHTTYAREPLEPTPPIFTELSKHYVYGDRAIVLPMTRELKPTGEVKSWGDYAELNINYMNWSFPFAIPIVNGYSGQRTIAMKKLPRELQAFPDIRSLKMLRMIHKIRFVVFCSAYVSDFDEAIFLERIEDMGNNISLLGEDAHGNYLLELKGKTRINSSFYLKVPSYPPSNLDLELMGLYQMESPEYEIIVHEEDHYGGAVIGAIKMKADGRWKTYTIPLPDGTNRSKPYKITFEKTGELDLFLRTGRRTQTVEDYSDDLEITSPEQEELTGE